MKEFIVSKYESNLDLKKYISLKLDANKAFLMIMKRKKLIRINGEHPLDYSVHLREGDKISFYINDSYFKSQIVHTPFDIIYEDDNIIIIDKDSGIMTHSVLNNHKSLLDLVIKYLMEKGEYIPKNISSFKPQISTRLDLNTKGLLIVSKNERTLKLINKLISNREIKKHYLALVNGIFIKKEGMLLDYSIFDSTKNKLIIHKEKVEGSKETKTGYKVLNEYQNISKIEIDLITGRTHQIRAHFSFYNHEIIGDKKYGNKSLNDKYNLKYQELISYKLIFPSTNLEHLSYLKNKEFISKKTFNLKNI